MEAASLVLGLRLHSNRRSASIDSPTRDRRDPRLRAALALLGQVR